MLLEGEKFEPLGSGIEVIVSKRHIFWTDTILLANFAKPKKSDLACDLGCGCGTIPLIWCRESATTPENILGVEIQQEAYDMACRSVEHNKLKDKINIINADLRNLNGITPFGIYNLVVCNPPYKAEGTGIVNHDSEIQTRQFHLLNAKLTALLPECPVTVVYPVIRRKRVTWIDPETGEALRVGTFRKFQTAWQKSQRPHSRTQNLIMTFLMD